MRATVYPRPPACNTGPRGPASLFTGPAYARNFAGSHRRTAFGSGSSGSSSGALSSSALGVSASRADRSNPRGGATSGIDAGLHIKKNGAWKRDGNNKENLEGAVAQLTQRNDRAFEKEAAVRTAGLSGDGGKQTHLQYPNWPTRLLGQGDYFNKSVLFALSTRPHSEGRDRVLPTAQRPSDQELICVEYRSKDEMFNDFQLKNDQCVLVEVNSLGHAFSQGISEGFQLVFVDGVRVKHADVCDTLEKLERFPAMLGFASPLAEPPNLSDRQCAARLGLNHVRQKLLQRASELMDALMVREGTEYPDRRFRLTFSKFSTVLRNAGLLALRKNEARDIFEALERDEEYGDVDMSEWQFGLSDKIMYDEQYSHILHPVTRQNIRDISRFMEQALRKKKHRALTCNEVASCLFRGGVTWLTKEQMGWIFEYLDEDKDGFVTFPEWAAQFHFDLIEAAHEVQRFLLNKSSFTSAGKGSGGHAHAPAARRSKRSTLVPKEMDLDLFILTLHAIGVHWLNKDQCAQLFSMMDVNRNGIVAEEEVQHIGELVEAYFENRALRRTVTSLAARPVVLRKDDVRDARTAAPVVSESETVQYQEPRLLAGEVEAAAATQFDFSAAMIPQTNMRHVVHAEIENVAKPGILVEECSETEQAVDTEALAQRLSRDLSLDVLDKSIEDHGAHYASSGNSADEVLEMTFPVADIRPLHPLLREERESDKSHEQQAVGTQMESLHMLEIQSGISHDITHPAPQPRTAPQSLPEQQLNVLPPLGEEKGAYEGTQSLLYRQVLHADQVGSLTEVRMDLRDDGEDFLADGDAKTRPGEVVVAREVSNSLLSNSMEQHLRGLGLSAPDTAHAGDAANVLPRIEVLPGVDGAPDTRDSEWEMENHASRQHVQAARSHSYYHGQDEKVAVVPGAPPVGAVHGARHELTGIGADEAYSSDDEHLGAAEEIPSEEVVDDEDDPTLGASQYVTSHRLTTRKVNLEQREDKDENEKNDAAVDASNSVPFKVHSSSNAGPVSSSSFDRDRGMHFAALLGKSRQDTQSKTRKLSNSASSEKSSGSSSGGSNVLMPVDRASRGANASLSSSRHFAEDDPDPLSVMGAFATNFGEVPHRTAGGEPSPTGLNASILGEDALHEEDDEIFTEFDEGGEQGNLSSGDVVPHRSRPT